MADVLSYFISRFRKNLDQKYEPARYYKPRPYRNAAVRFRDCSINDFEERRDILLNEAGLNPFLFRANKIPGCDLLSDSGTTTMTMEQWAAMLLGDEAYGSNEGYFELKAQMAETFGPSWKQKSKSSVGDSGNLFIFHQGRAAENAFFTVLSRDLGRKGYPAEKPLSKDVFPELRSRIESRTESISCQSDVSQRPYFLIPSNFHFDTTEGNIEDKNLVPLNLPCREHLENNDNFRFRGNMDTEKLKNILENEHDRVPLVYLTITNNTGGGQPVSLANIKEIRKITRKHGIPFFFDACRFAENAWFIQQKEEGFGGKSIREIVHEMFECVDGFHISLKKDGLVNIGGAILVKEEGDFVGRYPRFTEELTDYQIMTEGHPTYGGLAGRDLKGIVEGLRTVTTQDYLDSRISQVQRFGARLEMNGIPVIQPIGGHAVYIDMDRFFEGKARDEDLKAIAFTALLLIAGHRVCELGLYAFGKFDGEKEIPPDPRVNFVRAAVPRLAYEDQDLYSAAEAIKLLFDSRDRIPGVNVDYGRDLRLRHFKSRFSFKE
ncbi:MAG: tryptophanase [Candidatus Krumholzibacteria bacterium]|nr:tryptophanase [Candidatus Krumholzibacteria bacterium]